MALGRPADAPAASPSSTATSASACSRCRPIDKLIGDIRAQLRRLRVGGQHLHRLQLRQRLPHGRAPAAGGQADRVRPRHPRAAGRRRAGRARPARRSTRLTANIDLRPTFQELAGALTGPRVEGRSLAPFLQRPRAGGLARRDADRAPRVRTRGRRPRRAGAARQGKPPSYNGPALPRRALRRVRQPAPSAGVLRPRRPTRTSAATSSPRSRPAARPSSPTCSRACARASGGAACQARRPGA